MKKVARVNNSLFVLFQSPVSVSGGSSRPASSAAVSDTSERSSLSSPPPNRPPVPQRPSSALLKSLRSPGSGPGPGSPMQVKLRGALFARNLLVKTKLVNFVDDEGNMLIHTYAHKQCSKIKVAICNHQADSLFICSLMSDLVIYEYIKEYGHV